MSTNKVITARQPANASAAVEALSIRRILCPMDFSEFSRGALRYATSLAQHFSANLYIQHTAEIPASLLTVGAEPMAIEQWRQQLPRVERELWQLVRASGVSPTQSRVIVNEGQVVDQILETISKENIDLLVMGTHGHKGFRHLLLGSTAEASIHKAPCPVLVIGHPRKHFAFPDQPDKIQLRTILLATDFSPHSDRAMQYAFRWACEWAAKVVVFHAVHVTSVVDLFPEYDGFFQKQAANAWANIGGIVPEAVGQWCEVDYVLRHGSPRDEILRVAEERDADLIIMGARGAGLTASPWGSVSSGVVREARFPVLVVREARP
ncbi:MAG: universal stress protein [Acidobacteria bacterium]|nr:universal stress protein [Acidobacteriota bacterium]